MIGVGKIKQYSNVLDKPLSKGKQEVSLSLSLPNFARFCLFNSENEANFEFHFVFAFSALQLPFPLRSHSKPFKVFTFFFIDWNSEAETANLEFLYILLIICIFHFLLLWIEAFLFGCRWVWVRSRSCFRSLCNTIRRRWTILPS